LSAGQRPAAGPPPSAASDAIGDGEPRTTAPIAVANAPVSYGAFEITVGIDPSVPDPLTLLDWVADAGYAGIDLGPPGYLGTGPALRSRLSERRLALAGGYLELPFSEPDKLSAVLSQLDDLLDTFDSAPPGPHPPRPTLADAGSEIRSRYPGRAAFDRSVGLDDAGWEAFGHGLAVAVGRCRRRDGK
jgi:inosose dehydratase